MHPPIITNAALVPQLHTALQDYTQWFRALISGLGRDNVRIGDVTLTTPDSWVALEPYLGDIYPDLLTAQRAVLAEMAVITPALMTGAGVPRSAIAGLTNAYLALQQMLMQHVNDILFTLSDIDFVSFLRHPQWLEREWGREMERLTRDGKTFCVCLIRLKIMPSDMPVSTAMPEVDLAHLRQAAAVMARCVRSFDDVFCLEDGVFVILLRQTNHAGGVRFVRRLQDVMVETGQKRPVPVDLGFISCVAEPVIGENLINLLTQMRQDMVNQAEEGQAIATRREISPLARYVASLAHTRGRDG